MPTQGGSLYRRERALTIQCGTKFLPVLIFANFAIFPAIRKNKFLQTE